VGIRLLRSCLPFDKKARKLPLPDSAEGVSYLVIDEWSIHTLYLGDIYVGNKVKLSLPGHH